MDKKTIKKIVAEPRIIPGVHTYCDRWCERCELAAHCSVYAIEQARGGSAGADLDSTFTQESLLGTQRRPAVTGAARRLCPVNFASPLREGVAEGLGVSRAAPWSPAH